MATTKKKKATSIGQVSYLTKQVASLEKDLVRKDIEKLDQKVDGVKTELTTKIDNLETNLNIKIDKVDSKIDWLKWLVGGGLTALLSIILYLHSDTKQDMKELKQDMNSRFDKIERAIESLKK